MLAATDERGKAKCGEHVRKRQRESGKRSEKGMVVAMREGLRLVKMLWVH